MRWSKVQGKYFLTTSYIATFIIALILTSVSYAQEHTLALELRELTSASPPTGLSLSSLTVENQVEPLGIDVPPRFSWIISSPFQNDYQLSYRIRVSPSPLTPASSGAFVTPLWDTGTVTSPKSFLIEYTGPQLASDTEYSWTVDVVTAQSIGVGVGESAVISASSRFTTGLSSPSDWGTSQWIGKPTPESASSPPSDLISAFQSASWIWTPESDPLNAPAGDTAFRKTFTAPVGNPITSAQILITADDQFRLFADGVMVGASPTTPDVWTTARFFSPSLTNSTTSVTFAVRATNASPGPAGLIAAIKVVFADGTSSIISTDSTWLSTNTIPTDWNSANSTTDTSTWTPSSVLFPYGEGPWGTQVLLPTSPASTVLGFEASTWIWSAESNPSQSPALPRAFRKTFFAPQGKTLDSARVVISVDNGYELYVNGELVGASPNVTDSWMSAQQFRVSLSGTGTGTGTTSVLFAVNATNLPDPTSGGGSPAGLLCVIQLTYSDGSTEIVTSDTSWKVQKSIPPSFEQPSTDDTSWANATSLGAYGVSPWGTQVSISDPLGEHPAPLLRTEFQLPEKTLAFARLYYSAGGYASITINGFPASDHVLTPGFTKYDTETQYVSIDVLAKLDTKTPGAPNAIGVELGRSHYGVTQGNVWNWDKASWHGEPRLRVVLSLGYLDGSRETIVSDGTWKVIEGPTRLDDVFGGENYDASFIQSGFDKPGFNSSSWATAAIMTSPSSTLVSQLHPPTRLIQSLTPTNITQPVPGIYVAHFARVVAGWVRLTAAAAGEAKTLITVHYGEKLNTDGTVIYQDTQHYYANNFQTDRFWLAGTGAPETFEPKFSYKGYQYIQIEGWPSGNGTGSPAPTAQDIIGQVVHDDLGIRGGFECSNDLLNRMHSAAVYTLLNNVHSIPTDCPTFEKNGWSGDAMLGTEMFLTNLNSQDLLAKYVRDLDESRPSGAGPPGVIAPDSGWGANNQAPTWHSAFIFIPWWIYQYRGDTRVLATHYTSMKNYIEFELGRSPNNIANTGLGDWDTPETSPLGGNPPEDPRVSATAFLYQMLTVMSQIATVLNQPTDASTFAMQAQNVKTAFNNAFLNPSTGYYTGTGDSGYRQTHNILSLAFGLVPNASTQTVADSIANDVNARGTHLNTGALGTKFLLPVLSAHGHSDTALALSEQTTFPSWGYWIVNGATTMWEHWLLDARSHDHLFLGTFEDWLFKYVAGIQSTSPAFQTVTISPLLSIPLTSVSAWTLTPFGNITVQWRKSPENVTVVLGVPVGVNATFVAPSTNLQNQMFLGSGRHELTMTLMS